MAPPIGKSDAKKPVAKKAHIDPWIGSRAVSSLESRGFDEFLLEKDVALVMFYDPEDPMCDWSKKHFLKAAKTTVRENHAYAAVDCTREQELCDSEGVFRLPFFKLYSKGKSMGTYSQPQSFIYHTMKNFVENAPVLSEAGRPKRPC